MDKVAYEGGRLLKGIAEYLIEKKHDAVIVKEDGYLKRSEKIESLLEQVEGYGLPKEQSLTIDKILSANNECNAYYSERLYMEGFKDCAALLLYLDKCSD